jgi:hypothetical protein
MGRSRDAKDKNATGGIVRKENRFGFWDERWRNPLTAPGENLAINLLKSVGSEPHLPGKYEPVLVPLFFDSADDPAPHPRSIQVVGESRKSLDDVFYVRGLPLPLDMSILPPQKTIEIDRGHAGQAITCSLRRTYPFPPHSRKCPKNSCIAAGSAAVPV